MFCKASNRFTSTGTPPCLRVERIFHFGWDLSQHGELPGCFGENPQCAISCEKGGEVWLLLSRHFQSDDSTVSSAKMTKQSAAHSHSGYISLYVFDTRGQRVFLSGWSITSRSLCRLASDSDSNRYSSQDKIYCCCVSTVPPGLFNTNSL